jgi:alpha-N-acetylglucosamine transferase
MPEVLPPKLIFQQFRKKVAFILLTISRAILVSCIWLIILPYFTVWIWRLYFYLGTHVSKRLVRLQEMKNQITSTSNITTVLFTTAAASVASENDFLVEDSQNDTTTMNWFQEYKSGLTMQ